MRDIVHVVLDHGQKGADRLAVRTYSRRGQSASRSFGQLASDARRAASFFHQHGLKRGDVVVLLGTHHIDLHAAWLGCVWLGAIPTVLAEPSVRIAREVYWTQIGDLLARIDAWGLAVDPRIAVDRESFPLRNVYTYEAICSGSSAVPEPITPAPDDVLLLQHSSGTTGSHKGVMLTHRAIWQHADSYNRSLELSPSDLIASWLPLYHDMGFIACFVNPLLAGIGVVWLSPFEWVVNPGLLLDAITEYRATLVWQPNFAFAFMAQRIKPEPGRFDLSSVRTLVNCSEPVSAEALRAFAARFAGDGLQPECLQACYAMAENVFAVSSSSRECPPRHRVVNRTIWHAEHRAEPCEPGLPNSMLHVSNGCCIQGCELRIVDSRGKILPPDVAGRVCIRSSFLFSGYFHRDDLNDQLFDSDGFYDTGDLGYVDDDGHVFVTGRAKDLVIIGGKNIYPQDVEAAVLEVAGVYAGRVVAFGVQLDGMGTEGLVVLAESEEQAAKWPEIIRKIRIAVPKKLDVDVYDARIVPRMELRKSTSGKLARNGNRLWYLSRRFGDIATDIQQEV